MAPREPSLKDHMCNFLYRGLRREEIEKGCVLIPRSQEHFKALPRFPLRFPVNFVDNPPENAIRDHQDGVYRSGVSTTPYFERAKLYAGDGIIVKIDRNKLKEFGIVEHVVKEQSKYVNIPEDDEVILVKKEYKIFPKQVIVDVIEIDNKGQL